MFSFKSNKKHLGWTLRLTSHPLYYVGYFQHKTSVSSGTIIMSFYDSALTGCLLLFLLNLLLLIYNTLEAEFNIQRITKCTRICSVKEYLYFFFYTLHSNQSSTKISVTCKETKSLTSSSPNKRSIMNWETGNPKSGDNCTIVHNTQYNLIECRVWRSTHKDTYTIFTSRTDYFWFLKLQKG